jgi:hypothetical protein
MTGRQDCRFQSCLQVSITHPAHAEEQFSTHCKKVYTLTNPAQPGQSKDLNLVPLLRKTNVRPGTQSSPNRPDHTSAAIIRAFPCSFCELCRPPKYWTPPVHGDGTLVPSSYSDDDACPPQWQRSTTLYNDDASPTQLLIQGDPCPLQWQRSPFHASWRPERGASPSRTTLLCL